MSQNPGQISPLPPLSRYVTGHNSSGKAIIQEGGDAKWKSYENNSMAFTVAYTTSEFPPNLNDDVDIKKNEEVTNSGKLGLVNPNGSVCRFVDFAPEGKPIMHRTQSLDYGIVLEGEIELLLDSGEVQLMKRGDIAVQRATMHAWRNSSKTEWARMLFVLQECQPLVVGGKDLGEDVSESSDIKPR